MSLNLFPWCALGHETDRPASDSIRRTIARVVIRVSALLICAAAGLEVRADPARFWISTSNILPSGPASPSLDGVMGSVRYLHIWAQPATIGTEQFDSETNPFQILQNFSLDVITESSPAIEFLDQIKVYNPEWSSRRRYSFVNDSSTHLKSASGLPDQIYKLQGYTIFPNQATGFGGKECAEGESYCRLTANDQPAWLVASVAYRVVAPEGTANFYLQLGETGLNHVNAESKDADVTFGALPSPKYNGSTGRQKHNGPNETADMVLTARSTAIPASAKSTGGNWNDPANWSGGLVPTWDNNVSLGADLSSRTVEVFGSQRANSTAVNGGRLAIREDSALASEVVVGQGGMVSGQGWIDSNLTLRGTLGIDSDDCLKVSGVADVTNGSLNLLSSYLQPPNTTSNVTVLQANGGVQGRLVAPAMGTQLRPGLFFEGLDYIPPNAPTEIVLKLRTADTGIPGDYSANGTVDAADYVLWRNGGPLRNEAQTIGTISSEDYTYWKSGFNSKLSQLSGDYNNDGSVDAADYVLWRKGWLLYNESVTPRISDAEDYAEWRLKFGSVASGIAAGAAASGVATLDDVARGAVPESRYLELLALFSLLCCSSSSISVARRAR